MKRKQKILISTIGIIIIILALLGITYAYFLTAIQGNTNTKSIEVSTADFKLSYDDGTNKILIKNNIFPGDVIGTKDFSVTNTGQTTVSGYIVYLEDIINTFKYNTDIIYNITCTSSDNINCNGVNNVIYPTSNSVLITNSIASGTTHSYNLSITYKETGTDQSDDMNKKIGGKIEIYDAKSINPYDTGIAETSNKNLAFNIINNAKLNKNGTSFVEKTRTIPGTEASYVGSVSGEYEDYHISSSEMPYGFSPWVTTDYKSGNTCNVFVGKDVRDQSGAISYTFHVEYCDGEIPVIKREKKVYEKELSLTSDNYGASYYYRGNVNDNYINFNNMCWKIVRIEGDGSVKIILEDQDEICSSHMNSNWNIPTITGGSTTNVIFGYEEPSLGQNFGK